MKTNRAVEIGKAAWHCPSIVRIDIKRTLASTGSASDGSGPTT